MTRLIDADALKKAICINEPISIDETWEQLYDAVVKAIDNAPTAEPEKVLVANVTFDEDKLKEIVQTDVIDKIKSGDLVIRSEKRPHGKWIKHEWGYSCSVCGVSNDYAYDNNIHKFTDYYCPNCGAKMDGEEADDETN